MSLHVVDANVVAKWFVPERLSEEAVRLLDARHELASPDLLWPELGNVLWKKARAGQLTGREAARIVQALEQFPVTFFPSRLVHALAGGPLASHVLWVGVPGQFH